jgi:hypothetical protein
MPEVHKEKSALHSTARVCGWIPDRLFVAA